MKPYTTYPDEKLSELFQQGDVSAFQTIYHRYLPALYDNTYRRLKNKEQAEDVLQEVFARFWVNRKNLNIGNLSAYLHTAVRNETINFITRHKPLFDFFAPFEDLLLENEGPDGKLIAKELLELTYAYADTLPEKRKQIFLLHIKNKMTTREIATALEISQKTVQNQLANALQGLKSKLDPMILLLGTACLLRK